MRSLGRLPRWVPPLVTFLAAYFTLDVLVVTIVWWRGVPIVWSKHVPSITSEIHDMILRVHGWVLGTTALLTGLARANGNHPVGQAGYRNWLRTTPWHPGVKLPLGPATLVWQDALILLGLCALAAWSSNITPVLVLLLFACSCALGSMQPLMKTETYTEAYLIALGGSVLLWLAAWSPAMLAGAAVLVLIGQRGLRRSLQTFPWEPPANKSDLNAWPIPIYPDFSPRMSLRRGLAIPLLVAAWVAGMLHVAGGDFPPGLAAGWIISLGCFASLIRLVIYSHGVAPPLSFWKRLFSGRLIIPGYDRVLVTPLAGVALSVAVPAALYAARTPAPIWAGLTTFAVLAVLLNGGPVLRVWQLTGFHRAVGNRLGSRGSRTRQL